MITMAVCAEKGGVGKTTITVNLAASLARKLRVLIVDGDPQDDCKLFLGLADQRAPGSLTDILESDFSISKAIYPVRDNIWLLEAGRELMGALVVLAIKEESDPFRLSKELAKVASVFDVCIIDTGPSRNLFTTMAICASDWILIPCESDDYAAATGAVNTNNLINAARIQYHLQGAQLAYVIPTFLDKRRGRATDDNLDALKEAFSNKLSSPIRTNSRIKDGPSYGLHIYERSDQIGMDDFDTLTGEVLSLVTGQ